MLVRAIVLIFMLLPFAPSGYPQSFVDSPQKREARLEWWREARFGMFIHWGIYSVPAGEWRGKPIAGIGEWIMNRAKIPVAEYEKLAGQFNPAKSDADEWVRLAKAAGQKYIVITSKHHDGFAMFNSQASDYDIVDRTPFKRDPMQELARACRREGIRLCFYYSQTQRRYTHVLNRGPGAVRSPADQLMPPATSDTRLTGNRSLNQGDPEARRCE